MNTLNFRLRAFALCAACVLLAGCDTLESLNPFSGSPDPTLKGKRISVLALDQTIKPDEAVADVPVIAPPATSNAEWPQSGGSSTHAMGNLAFGSGSTLLWRVSIGDGSSSGVKLLTQPIVVGNTIYAMDASAMVSALNTADGDRKWHVTISPEDAREETLGGGLSFGDGWLYASAGFPEVKALNPQTGETLWTHGTNAPVRGAPTFLNGRLFVLTIDNEVLALDAATGKEIWTHSGAPQSEAYLSDAGTAADPTVVIAPYSSGEVYALNADTGRAAWEDNLAAVRRASALWSLTDFNGLPIIDNGRVYAVSVSGRIVSIDERTGTRMWQHEIGSSSTPWIAGDFLYMISPDNQLIAIQTSRGGIRWVSQMARYQDEDKRDYPIFWTGPVMAGGRLIIGNSAGQLAEYSIADGKLMQTITLPDPVFVQPVVAGGVLYIVTDGGDLLAFR